MFVPNGAIANGSGKNVRKSTISGTIADTQTKQVDYAAGGTTFKPTVQLTTTGLHATNSLAGSIADHSD